MMATDDTKIKAAEADKAAADDERPVNAAALGLSKHITAWRDSYGDETVDEAVKLSAEQRKAVADERAEAQKADAARARAFAGQQRDAAPAGRTAADPKASAKT